MNMVTSVLDYLPKDLQHTSLVQQVLNQLAEGMSLSKFHLQAMPLMQTHQGTKLIFNSVCIMINDSIFATTYTINMNMNLHKLHKYLLCSLYDRHWTVCRLFTRRNGWGSRESISHVGKRCNLFYNYLVPINVADGKESKDLCRWEDKDMGLG